MGVYSFGAETDGSIWTKTQPNKAFSQDEHGVAVAEEAVPAGHGVAVDLQEPVDPVGGPRGEEGGDEAEEGRAGLVEIGDQHVGPAEGRRRVEEEGRLGHDR